MFGQGYWGGSWDAVPPQMMRQWPQGVGQPQPQQSAPQGRAGGPDWVTVPNVSDIANVSIAPGVKAWIMAQNEPVFAVKEADAVGITTTSYYKFERYDPEQSRSEGQPEFVTRAEFEQLREQLTAQIGGFVDE